MTKEPRFFCCENGHEVTVQSWGEVPRKCPVAVCSTALTEVTVNGNPKRNGKVSA